MPCQDQESPRGAGCALRQATNDEGLCRQFATAHAGTQANAPGRCRRDIAAGWHRAVNARGCELSWRSTSCRTNAHRLQGMVVPTPACDENARQQHHSNCWASSGKRMQPRSHRTSYGGLAMLGKELERETGFEPATSTLARSHSTTELLPLSFIILHDQGLSGPVGKDESGLRWFSVRR